MKISSITLVLLVALLSGATGYNNNEKPNVFALILNTSKFWFNFRQTTNALLFYKFLKEHGIPEENIILLLPDNVACNPRNNAPGTISCVDNNIEPNIYQDLELDYKGSEVSSINWLNLIRKRYPKDLPERKRLRTNEDSTLFIYMTGHGGDGYHKIQDTDIMTDVELAIAVKELYQKKGYKDLFLYSDSCGAFTIFSQINKEDSPNVVMLGSSSEGEKSYSEGKCNLVGLSKTDRFTKQTVEELYVNHDLSFESLFRMYDPMYLDGHPNITHTYPKKSLQDISVASFVSTEFKNDFAGLNFESEAIKDGRELRTLSKLDNLFSA